MRHSGPDAARADARTAPGPAVAAIVPARIGSTRLPRKMLLDETGMPLVVHTARAVAACGAIGRVVVATDSDEVLAAARAHGIEAVATRADHASGTDRVYEAYRALAAEGGVWDVVLNVQGDEPDVAAADLAALVAAFADSTVEIATLFAPIEDAAELESPSAVKVVRDAAGDALYFSRAPIPSTAHARPDAPAAPLARHVGVYAFRPDALARFCALAPGALERVESLEQLRWLEAGGRMRVVPATHRPRGVDTAEEYAEFVRRHAAPSDPRSAPSSP